MGYLAYLIFRCDEKFEKFGEVWRSKHTHSIKVMLKINCGQSMVTGVLDLDQTQEEAIVI